jgi:hypothetical protein
LSVSAHVLPPFHVTSSAICCSHLDLCLSLVHFPFSFILKNFCGIPDLFILKICPDHLILLLTNLSSNVLWHDK